MKDRIKFSSKNFVRSLFDQQSLSAQHLNTLDGLFCKNALSWRQCAYLFQMLEDVRKDRQ